MVNLKIRQSKFAYDLKQLTFRWLSERIQKKLGVKNLNSHMKTCSLKRSFAFVL